MDSANKLRQNRLIQQAQAKGSGNRLRSNRLHRLLDVNLHLTQYTLHNKPIEYQLAIQPKLPDIGRLFSAIDWRPKFIPFFSSNGVPVTSIRSWPAHSPAPRHAEFRTHIPTPTSLPSNRCFYRVENIKTIKDILPTHHPPFPAIPPIGQPSTPAVSSGYPRASLQH